MVKRAREQEMSPRIYFGTVLSRKIWLIGSLISVSVGGFVVNRVNKIKYQVMLSILRLFLLG